MERAVTGGGARPIFILGMSQRSGTNYLWDLLKLHPSVGWREPIWEDHLLQHAGHLLEYEASLRSSWTDDWEVPAETFAELVRGFGDAIVRFLAAGTDAPRVITKTPSPANIERFFDFFPEALLLVVVRDGRSVSESMVQSGFTRTYEAAIRDWARAAQAVISFDEAHHARHGDRYRIVRYEDIVTDLRRSLGALLSFCDLPIADYDFDAAERLPVRGSSTLRSEGGEEVHWAPQEKPEGFRPEIRWEGWTARRHHRFNDLAGEAQRILGYHLLDVGHRRPQDRLRAVAGNATWIAHRVHRAYRRRRVRATTRRTPDR